MHKQYIKHAIEIADRSIDAGGGPFGAVIVKNNEIIAEASNRVTMDNDPTAHAEVIAIREAGAKLGDFDLSGCALYTSCEPCPMCLGAIYWSRISAVFFSSDRRGAEKAGFDDSLIYEELAKPVESRKLKMVRLQDPAADQVFSKWISNPNKTRY